MHKVEEVGALMLVEYHRVLEHLVQVMVAVLIMPAVQVL
jgi:hypothetical protein